MTMTPPKSPDSGKEAKRCVHCMLVIPPGDLVVSEYEGEELEFCCNGCVIAYKIIHGAGLADFYTKRKWTEPGTPSGVFEQRYDDEYLKKFLFDTPEGKELALLVDGVRCASCVWVIEKILSTTAGIKRARLSYSSHLLSVTFDPEQITGAEVVATVCSLGYLARPYTATAAEEIEKKNNRSLMVRFGTAAFLSMQLMGFSIALYSGEFHGIDPESRIYLQWAAFAVATPVVFYCGWPFISGGVRAIRNRAPDMDLLIALGVGASYGYSVFSLFTGGEVYFDSSAMIVTFLLVGRLFENLARRRAVAGVHRLMGLAPDTAHRVEATGDGEVATVDVASGDLARDDLIRVLPGERFPADGVVEVGGTEVDEAVVTGEPFPVMRTVGDAVTSGTMNLTTAVDVRVTGAGADSFISRMARLVEGAQTRKPPVQRLADRVSAFFVPLVLAIATSTFIGWLAMGAETSQALLNAVSVLVVACPCALGLATPTAIVVSTGRAASRGILFRGGDVLERLGKVTRASFDKTGTLTLGKPDVMGVDTVEGFTSQEVVRIAAIAEAGSRHPVARAISQEAGRMGVAVGGSGGGAENIPGRGVRIATPEGEIKVGSRDFVGQAGVDVPAWQGNETQLQAWVAKDSVVMGRIRLEDKLRPEAVSAISELKGLGLPTAILTGDSEAAGALIGETLGVDEVHARLDPEGKSRIIGEEQERGERVLMVGDGINDAVALGASTVGCAIGGATDVALETADLIMVRPDLGRIPEAIILSRRTLRVIRQNLGWAFVYNVTTLFLAVAGKLAPIHAAAAMALSSICVVGNSLRLAGKKV